MTRLDEEPCRVESAPAGHDPSQFDWEWRVMAVVAVWTIPGVLAGVLIRLCLPDGGPAEWWLAGGESGEAAGRVVNGAVGPKSTGKTTSEPFVYMLVPPATNDWRNMTDQVADDAGAG